MVAPEELSQQLATEGGFSLSPAGRWAHSGQMVSRAGAEEVHSGIATPDQIASYQQRHAVEFKRRGYFLGGWLEDTPTGGKQTVLDVSQRFPHGPAADLQAAIHHQRATYDVDKGDVRDVPPVLPFSDLDRFDVEEIHHPKIRHSAQIFGERGRRQQAAQSAPTQAELPFSAGARRRLGMV